MLAGIPTKCSTVMRLLGSGAAAGGVISGTANPLVELAGMGLVFTSKDYTAVVKRIPGSSAIAISRIVEGSSTELTFLEKELRYKQKNIVIYTVSIAPGRQTGSSRTSRRRALR